MDLADKLQIKVIEAEDLINVQGLPPTAFVELVVGQNTKKTREVKDCKSPIWNAAPIIFEHVLGDGIQTVLAYVFHYDEVLDRKTCLGVAIIPMDTFYHSPEVEQDYWYDLTATSTMTEKVDKSRLRLQILYDNDMDADMYPQSTGEVYLAPNLLQITVHGASELNTKNAVEAFVECQVGNLRKETKISKKSTHPTWNEVLEIPVTDGNELINITMKQTTMIRSVFVGRVRIAMNEVAAAGEGGITRLFTLLNENFEFSETNRGELNLTIKWAHDKGTEAVNKSILSGPKMGIFKKLTQLMRKKPDEPKVEEEVKKLLDADAEVANKLGAAYDLSPLELSQYLEEQRSKRLEEINALLDDQSGGATEEVEMPEGDYTIQINIVEVSDLVGLNASGLSDPVITVEVLGLKRQTSIKKEVNSAYFDETLYFNFQGLQRDQVTEGQIKISVYDWNRFRSWELIGVYSVDLPSVYQSKDHEVYRKWVSLRDPTNPEEFGSQGLLKYSAVCLGPGDLQKIHDPATEEEEDEHDLEVSEGTGVVADDSHGGQQTLQFLVFALVRAEGLPGFDRFMSTIKNGLYTYAQVEFAGCKPLKTSKVSVSGKKNLSVKFEEELWIPVWVPSQSKRAAITIMNRELGRKDQVIATAYVNFEDVPKYDRNPVATEGGFGWLFASQVYKGQNLQWIHFYGANQLVRGGGKEAMFMNKFPNHASAYRGSLLAGLRVVKDTSGTNHGEAAHRLPMDYEIPEALIPQGALYVLRVMIYQGSDFGSKGNAAGAKGGAKYALGINIGPHECRTAFRTYEEGAVDWLQLVELPDLPLPREYKMLPDTFITVYKGTEKSHQSVAFTRLKTLDLLPARNKEPVPKWFELQHDLSHQSNSTAGYPGSALLKIALTNVEDVEDQVNWEPERRKMEIRNPYCLRVLIYQCRGLPAVDSSGCIDPYVKVRFAGSKRKTAARKMTQNPIYYETMEFHQMLPQDLSLAPHILVQIWDNKTLSHTPVAALRYAVTDVQQFINIHTTDIPTPVWRPLMGIDGKQNLGEILIGFQLFVKKESKQVLPSCRDIAPTFKKAYVDLHLVGLRGLLNKGKNNVKKASLQFDIGGGHSNYCTRITSKSSRTPSAANPNFLDRQCVMLSLPDEALYMPALEIKVFDERMAGKVLIGSASIDLLTKVPWNTEDYIAPRNHEIVAANEKERAEQKKRKVVPKDTKRVKNSGGKKGSEGSGSKNDDEDEDLLSFEEQGEQKPPPDSGVGVFAPKIGAKEHGARYLELPTIIDQEQEEAERQRLEEERLNGLLGLKHDSDFNKIVDSGSHMDALKKVVGIPTAWVNADFLKGREWWMQSKKPGWGGELEKYLETYPFEMYTIYSGHIAFNKFGKRKNTVRKAGVLKAVIRITQKNPRYDEEYGLFFKTVKNVIPCKVRVYVIKAQNLHYTEGMFGGPPDPYLSVSLEGKVYKDKKHVCKGTTAPEFFECYEFDTKLPGPSLLKVGVMDKNYMQSDKSLGETVIDLEDRWFHPKWTNPGDVEKKGDLKPCEIRTLYKDSTQAAQGAIMLWVDIIPQADLLKYPKVEIMGPQKMKFELRVVCWRSQNIKVHGQKSLDLFARFFMEGDEKHKQDTDTHWFCKTGSGSWNWRIKIALELPIKARELGKLKIQMWERNVITSNTIVGESFVSLYDWFMLAYRRQNSGVSPFKELKDAEKKLGAMGGFSMEEGEDTTVDDLLADMPTDPRAEQEEERRGINSDGDDDDDNDGGDLELGTKTSVAISARNEAAMNDDTAPLLGDKSIKGGKTSSSSDNSSSSAADAAAAAKQDQEDEDEESDEVIKMVNSYLGRGDAIADDADWLTLTYHDRDANKVLDRGKLAVSIQILPMSEVEMRPAGYGRSEPNDNPVLQAPFGRFSFSFNPLKLLLGLCSAKVVCILVCLCCTVCALGIFMFLSTYLSGIEALIQMLGGND